MDINIRQGRLEDAKQLADIETICFPEAEAASYEAIKARLEHFADCFLVVEYDGRSIGFINGMVTDMETIEDVLFEDASLHNKKGVWQSVFGLDVLPEYRNRGYAAALMERLIAKAREEGRAGCILTCKEQLIHYYSRFGYVNKGLSKSQHGGAVWYDMVLKF